ncbi:hypothetical protein [Escherichia coli]
MSSLFPDNLPVCLNIITGAWSLYFAFRVKAFILGNGLGLMKRGVMAVYGVTGKMRDGKGLFCSMVAKQFYRRGHRIAGGLSV